MAWKKVLHRNALKSCCIPVTVVGKDTCPQDDAPTGTSQSLLTPLLGIPIPQLIPNNTSNCEPEDNMDIDASDGQELTHPSALTTVPDIPIPKSVEVVHPNCISDGYVGPKVYLRRSRVSII